MKYVIAFLAGLLLGYGVRLYLNKPAPSVKVALDSLHHQDSTRRVSHLATDSVRAGSRRRVDTLSLTSARTGATAAHLLDSLIDQSPPDFKPLLDSLERRFALHLAADTLFRDSVKTLLVRDSLDLSASRAETDSLIVQRDDAYRRIKPSRFWPGVALGAALVTAVKLLLH